MSTPIDPAAVITAANAKIADLQTQTAVLDDKIAIYTDIAANPLAQSTHEGVAALNEILQGVTADA